MRHLNLLLFELYKHPYNLIISLFSFEFYDYSEGIETVAKSLVKYYLNPAGTKIYDGETADGRYFNGPTVLGVNTRYATDKEWHQKVFKYMQTLYDRL